MSSRRQNHEEPMRRCIGCMTSKPQKELIRIAYRDGALTVDKTGKAPGRGVYLCRQESCIAMAEKRNGLQRALKTGFTKEQTAKVYEEVRSLISADGEGMEKNE
ncbi:MAG: YlxR family protein [Eubacterium sp.]|nr:YlxR family protein [Eubacterium sp.]MCH4046193.1 YlxR family protein [Eubacterium sp.]MCH4079288.1 YlxR family protein [Eubacterium sp.]MCH4110512.1 YlxR family protein [Eubacterium sp.]MCI1307882.1 YlxR family protein [Eubacterium sp.]